MFNFFFHYFFSSLDFIYLCCNVFFLINSLKTYKMKIKLRKYKIIKVDGWLIFKNNFILILIQKYTLLIIIKLQSNWIFYPSKFKSKENNCMYFFLNLEKFEFDNFKFLPNSYLDSNLIIIFNYLLIIVFLILLF